jgi:hypothetical protein
MLEELGRARQRGEHAEMFARIRFVYLHKPREELVQHLALPTAESQQRTAPSQQWDPEIYDRFDRIFVVLADRTIECSGKGPADVAAEVEALAQEQP